MTCENLGSGQAAPRDERRAGHGRRGQVPAPTCSRRLPTSPRCARGGAAAAAHLCGRSVGGARPGPNMRRGSRPPPFHIMPGGCGGRARWGAAGAAAAARASFLQPPELRATPPWSLPRAAAGAGGPGAGGGRGAASSRAAGGDAARHGAARARVAERRPPRPGVGGPGERRFPNTRRHRGRGTPVFFQVLVFLPCLAWEVCANAVPVLQSFRSCVRVCLCLCRRVSERGDAPRPAGLQPGPSTCARIARRAHELLCTHRVLP